jgi:hypothetical protein
MSRYTAENYVRDQERLDSLANALGASFEKKAERERAQADMQAKMEHEKQMAVDKAQREREQRERDLQTLKDPQYKDLKLKRVGDVSVEGEGDGLSQLLGVERLKLMRDEEARRVENASLNRLAKATESAGRKNIPQTLQSIKQIESYEDPQGKLKLGMAARMLPSGIASYIAPDRDLSILSSVKSLEANYRKGLFGSQFTGTEKKAFEDIVQNPSLLQNPDSMLKFKELVKRGTAADVRAIEGGLRPDEVGQYRQSIGFDEAPAGGALKRSADGNSTADMQQSGGTGLGGAAAPKTLSPEEFTLRNREKKKAQSLQGN